MHRTHPSFRATILGLGLLAGLAMFAVTLYTPAPAQAQLPPYKAWGGGRPAGEVIRALKGSTEVGQVTVNASGTWEINISLGGPANVVNGDMIGFTVNGRAANEMVTYQAGQFVLPPGLSLTISATATPGPTATPVATVAGRGTLAGTPVFDTTGRALAVFNAGSVDELVAEGARNKANGVWVQDLRGMFQLYVIGGPAFLGDQFRATFASGFGVTSVLLVK